MGDVLLKRFENADEVRTFEKGKYEVATVGQLTVGRATYQPGWKWSLHVGALSGAALCEVEHVGLVLSGHAKVRMRDGREFDLRTGDFFYVAAGHDSWVVGQDPYVSLHFQGVDQYARK
jgi:mannose-6-phosphate isomerase-like protein (cupin superfamily)